MKRKYRNNFAKEDARKRKTSRKRGKKRQSGKEIFSSILKKDAKNPILEILQQL